MKFEATPGTFSRIGPRVPVMKAPLGPSRTERGVPRDAGAIYRRKLVRERFACLFLWLASAGLRRPRVRLPNHLSATANAQLEGRAAPGYTPIVAGIQ